MTDVEFSSRFRAGEQVLSARLYRSHSCHLRSILLRRGCPREQCDDLIQRTWLRAYEARARLDPQRPFRAWLGTIALRLWWDELRRQHRRIQTLSVGSEDLLEPGADGWQGFDLQGDGGLAQEDAAELGVAIALLPLEQREAILLTRYEGLTIQDAAAVLGIGVPGLKTRISRGYGTLRTFLQSPESRPQLPQSRLIEVEIGGCGACDDLLQLLDRLRCPSCEIRVRRTARGGPHLTLDGRAVVGMSGALVLPATIRALGVGACARRGLAGASS